MKGSARPPDACVKAVAVRHEQLTVPAGAFDAVVYQTRQPMEGVYQQYAFAPGVGLIQIAGVDAETGRDVFAFRLKKEN